MARPLRSLPIIANTQDASSRLDCAKEAVAEWICEYIREASTHGKETCVLLLHIVRRSLVASVLINLLTTLFGTNLIIRSFLLRKPKEACCATSQYPRLFFKATMHKTDVSSHSSAP